MATRNELPDKLYFKIGEVAQLVGVKAHVLRYWESEFPSIRPQKSKTNQRLYRRSDVEAILAVKHLLYDRKFTIEGAKKHLRAEGVNTSLPPPDVSEIEERARKEAFEAVQDDMQRETAKLIREQEKQLLALRQELLDFIKYLDDDQA